MRYDCGRFRQPLSLIHCDVRTSDDLIRIAVFRGAGLRDAYA